MSDPAKDSIEMARPDRLAKLMRLSRLEESPWTDEQLQSVFEFQMEALLPVEMDGASADRAEDSGPSGNPGEGRLIGLRQLFEQPRPSIVLLEQTKDYAKVCLAHPRSPWPQDVARVIYYLCLAAALVRRGTRLTSLGAEDFQNGLEWAAGRTWVDAASKKLLARAQQLL